MNRKQAVLQALDHRPGRIPIDFGGTGVSGIHVSVVAALRRHYGLSPEPVRVLDPYLMLGEIAPDLVAAMDLDCVALRGRGTLFGYTVDGPWREWRSPWGQVVLVPAGFQTTTAANGDTYIYPAGDRTAPPSGLLPATGYYFDAVIRQEPIDEDRLDPADNLEDYQPMSEADAAHWQSRAEALRGCPHAVVAAVDRSTSLGNIANVSGPYLRRPKGIRDVAEWYVSLVARRDYVRAIFAGQTEIALENLARFRGIAGDVVDVLYTCGTDFGTQESQFCSAAAFDDLFLPYYRRVNDWVHENTKWKVFKHCCGAIDPLLPSFIRAGFDIINPVQCSAAGMDPEHLKKTYGRDLVFWGGGIDTQRTLPYGTAAQVRAEVLERCRIFGRGGGFVFNAVHNIQPLTPVGNVAAMLDAVREFNSAGA